jgi:uncharacterized protein YvpB
MVLDYLGQPVRYARLMKLLDITPDLGAPASNIKRLAKLNVSVEYGTGALGNLASYLSQGIPGIAFVHTVHLSYWSEAVRHAVVVVGVDERRVYLNDPFFDMAPQTVSRLEFELAWDEMDNTYAVITR